MREAAGPAAADAGAGTGQPLRYAPGAPIETLTAGSIGEQRPASLHSAPPPVTVNMHDVIPPMVQFSAPPPPPLFDPTAFLSGSIAGATRLPSLPAFPGAPQFPGTQLNGPYFTGVPVLAASGAGALSGSMPSSFVPTPISAPSVPATQEALGDSIPTRLGTPQPASTSTRATASAAAGVPTSSPTPSVSTKRPVTPPALKRAGARRAAGVRHPRISSAPAAAFVGSMAVSSSTTAAASASTPAAASATVLATAPGRVRDTAAIVAAKAARTAASARRAVARAAVRKPGGKYLTRKQTDSSSDDEVVSVPAVPKQNQPKEVDDVGQLSTTDTQKVMAFINSASGLMDTLDDLTGNVRLMRRSLETQASKVEDLTVSVKDLKKSPPKFKRRFVDTDGEEYSDHEEMNTLFGNGTCGSAVLSTTSAAAAAAGKKLSYLQEGTLKMLRVRGRVKSRTFGNIGGAVFTRDVLQDAEADWKLIVGETKEELSVNEAHANSFLLSDISPPTPRNSSRKASKKGKDKIETRRAYQPLSQAISHILEAIKKRVVAAWFFEINSAPDKMTTADATAWLSNCRDEAGGNEAVKPRFEASELGLKGMLAAVKAMFTHLGVKDRIRLPTKVGDAVHVTLAWGHLALCAAFVRAALEQIEAGGARRRTGTDSGWYDRWRWEVLALKAFVPQSKALWNGMVVSDADDPSLFVFPEDPVPVSGARTLVALAQSMAGDESEGDGQVTAPGGAASAGGAASSVAEGAAAADAVTAAERAAVAAVAIGAAAASAAAAATAAEEDAAMAAAAPAVV